MAVLKDTRATLTSVLVDFAKDEANQAPAIVLEAYRKIGGSMPIVIVTDPGVTKVYGSYNLASLRSKDFRQIFSDARRDYRSDNSDGSIPKLADVRGGAATPGVSNGTPTEGAAPAPVADADFSATSFATWTSAQGSSIEARISGIEGDRILFLRRDGRQIPVAADQLDAASLERARKDIEEITGTEFARPAATVATE